MQMLTEEQKMTKVSEIAEAMGVPLTSLLEGKTPEQVIEQYEAGNLGVLND